MPSGLRGTVVGMDDREAYKKLFYKPALLMNWDNGRGLSILPYEDLFRKLTDKELIQEKAEQQQGEGGIKFS